MAEKTSLTDLLQWQSSDRFKSGQTMEPAQAVQLINVEQRLLLLINDACMVEWDALETMLAQFRDGVEVVAFEAAMVSVIEAREAVVRVINDLSAFSIDPFGWIATHSPKVKSDPLHQCCQRCQQLESPREWMHHKHHDRNCRIPGR